MRIGNAPFGRQAALLCVYFVAYIAFDWASYVYPVVPLGITPWNPPAGLSLTLLLLNGVRLWPALFVAALAADVIVRGTPANPGVLAVAAGIITVTYTSAAAILLRFSGSQTPLESTRDLMAFLVVSVISTLLVAVGFVGLYALVGIVSPNDIAVDVLKYWVGDLNGILVLTPALLCLFRASNLRVFVERFVTAEVALQVTSLACGLYLVFAFAGQYPYRSFYVLFLPLIWISARWGLPGAALAQLAIQIGLLVGVQIADYHSATFVQLQLLMSGLCVTGLTLGGMSSHRARLQASLQERQADLSRAQQLASAGEMTSALAHQLNQPMTALNSYIAACRFLLKASPIDVGRLQELMDKASAESQRAGDVVSGLRDFYQRGLRHAEETTIATLVGNVAEMCRRQAERGGISLVMRDAAVPLSVRVDRLQIENALQNILTNAIEAVGTSPPSASVIEMSISSAEGQAEVRVRDTGPGIGADVSTDLFEPFVTSKSSGMGMGLVIARSLVRANGGELKLESSSASGACFLLTLPLRT